MAVYIRSEGVILLSLFFSFTSYNCHFILVQNIKQTSITSLAVHKYQVYLLFHTTSDYDFVHLNTLLLNFHYVSQCPTTGCFPSLWARSLLSSQCESCISPSHRATGGPCSGDSPFNHPHLGPNSGCGSRTLSQSEYSPPVAA